MPNTNRLCVHLNASIFREIHGTDVYIFPDITELMVGKLENVECFFCLYTGVKINKKKK